MSVSLFRRRIPWRKRGLIVTPRPDLWWMRSHAMVPTPEPLGGSVFRVYFSGRDDRNRSHIGFAVIDVLQPEQVLEFSSQPVLAPGELGCFDDNGVTPSSVIHTTERTHLYYIGWNPGVTVRMHLFGGLATSPPGSLDFTRYSRAPIIERSRVDPFLNTAPFAMRDEATWRMYYVAGIGWKHADLPRYNIKLATSKDGLEWQRDGHVCLDFQSDAENALARPWVLREDGVYKMWFAHKGDEYRLGYAESLDGREWHRDDSYAGVAPSPFGWDSQMVEYAAVVAFGGQHFMFYNGNRYGADGFGLAEEE